jgi:aconitase A
MSPVDLMRMQMALAFGALEMQRRLMGAAWQVALWSMPGVNLTGAALPGVGSKDRPAGRRKGRA